MQCVVRIEPPAKSGSAAQTPYFAFPSNAGYDSIAAASAMSNIASKPRTKVKPKVERPRLHKVILVNDDYTPREFVVMVLKSEFRMNEYQALRVMLTAHRRGTCVVAVYTKDIAEAKATNATDAGRRNAYPLLLPTEP